MKVVLCCLDGENVVGSCKHLVPWHIATNWRRMTKLLSQHFRCTALGIYLWLYSCSLIAWPKLSCVYCTGKASGWFFRHEMSDLFGGSASYMSCFCTF